MKKFGFPVALALVFAALTAAIYWQTRTFQLVNWDDGLYINNNIHDYGLTWENIAWAWTSVGHGSVWSPLLWLSFQLEYSLGLGRYLMRYRDCSGDAARALAGDRVLQGACLGWLATVLVAIA